MRNHTKILILSMLAGAAFVWQRDTQTKLVQARDSLEACTQASARRLEILESFRTLSETTYTALVQCRNAPMPVCERKKR